MPVVSSLTAALYAVSSQADFLPYATDMRKTYCPFTLIVLHVILAAVHCTWSVILQKT